MWDFKLKEGTTLSVVGGFSGSNWLKAKSKTISVRRITEKLVNLGLSLPTDLEADLGAGAGTGATIGGIAGTFIGGPVGTVAGAVVGGGIGTIASLAKYGIDKLF